MRASEMKKGQTVKVDGNLYSIVDYQHVKLGKGGAVYQTKLKSLKDGNIRDIRLRAEEIIEDAYLDKREYEYLYSAGSEHVLGAGDQSIGLRCAVGEHAAVASADAAAGAQSPDQFHRQASFGVSVLGGDHHHWSGELHARWLDQFRH